MRKPQAPQLFVATVLFFGPLDSGAQPPAVIERLPGCSSDNELAAFGDLMALATVCKTKFPELTTQIDAELVPL